MPRTTRHTSIREKVRHHCLTSLAMLLLTSPHLQAQDLLITNVQVINSAEGSFTPGNILIRDGLIASVDAPASATSSQILDGSGLYALPGFIDGHRHIMPDDDERWLAEQAPSIMQSYLDAGFTTLMSGGGPVPGIIELRDAIASGALAGPRIISSGRVDPEDFRTEATARAEVRALANAGVEIIKARLEPGGEAILEAVTDEAGRHGLDVMVHAVTVELMVAAVAAGADKLVHTPTRGLVTDVDGVRIVSEAGIEMTSTLGIWVPIYGADNTPLWRDRTPFPVDGISRAGLGPINGRHLWDGGVVYGFGTDTSFLPAESLAHELIPLRLLFSPADIVQIMGPHSAAFINRSHDLGALVSGKLADIVLTEGNPLEDTSALLTVRVVIKDGGVAVDRRSQ